VRNQIQPDPGYLRDSGLAAVLLLLIIAYWQEGNLLVLLAMAVMVVALLFPRLLGPWAFLWRHFSFFLGSIISRILLTLIFIFVVLPVGLIRRVMGYDPMKKKEWKKGRQSVFILRRHVYTASDLDNPY
jgi:hypothetical protein